jgi:urea carboxylase
VASVIEVLSPGSLTTIQDWPGRLGFWELGVPPSGPMDARSLRIANTLVGNPEGAAGLEITLTGPRLRFTERATAALTGAPIAAKLDGKTVSMWEPFDLRSGSVLALGAIRAVGVRSYLALRGGIRGPRQMGSRSTFAAGGLGTDPLRADTALGLGSCIPSAPAIPSGRSVLIPELGNQTTLRVVPGPHGAPEILTERGLEQLLGARWSVHHQSDRTGVRLVGPRPEWARADGGVAGLHPSNILDSAYGVGTVMLAGEQAVIVGCDGPSLGGFAAVAQVIRADLWRLGQLRAGDEVGLQAVDPEHAVALHNAAEAELREFKKAPQPSAVARPGPPLAVHADGAHGPVTVRQAGEGAILVEFGEPVLELRSRVRAHTLQRLLRAERLAGVRDLTPGVRSLHIQFEPERIGSRKMLDVLTALEASTPAPEAVTIAARAVHLPLTWRHSQAMLAVARYRSGIRPDAPWCPDNIEFIRRINGLPDEDTVREIVTAARYLVLGLGDVYMGAPVAVPLDPRHRLVTTKYTPARTWTPANAVGIGGTFLCVYGVEGPGGYQLVGRTVPIWYHADESPCLLDHFDELRFHLVDEAELEQLRREAARGDWRPPTEPVEFSLGPHERFVADHADEIDRFTSRREAAFEAERQAWAAAETTEAAA